jgi:hypothetical protein
VGGSANDNIMAPAALAGNRSAKQEDRDLFDQMMKDNSASLNHSEISQNNGNNAPIKLCECN